jgi:exosortase/archaeosortase family protein
MSFLGWVRQAQQLFLSQDERKYYLAAGYLATLATIASIIYYLPNYGWLEYATAYNSAQVMNFIGIPAVVKVNSNIILLNEFVVDKPCTGIQLVATFMGILLPLPKLAWFRKMIGIVIVTLGVYIANIFRIVVQMWVYYGGFFNWTVIHGPGGVALGIISVTLLVILLDRFVPEFGDFVFSIFKR